MNIAESLIPEKDVLTQPKEPIKREARIVMFEDVEILENLTDTLSEKELKEYQNNFDLLQDLVAHTNNEEEKKVLTGNLIRVIMGFAAEGSLEIQELTIVLQVLERVGVKDRFTVMKAVSRTGNLVVYLINIPAAQRLLRQNQLVVHTLQQLNHPFSLQELNEETTVEALQLLYDHPDSKTAIVMRGIFSGFPTSSAKAYAEIAIHDKKHILPIEDQILKDIAGGIDPEVINDKYRSMLLLQEQTQTPKEALDSWVILDKHTLVGKFGVFFRTEKEKGLNEEEMAHCQRLLEIDRNLGLQAYLDTVKSQE